MESSNAVVDVSCSNASNDNPNQVVSSVPDLVTDVSVPAPPAVTDASPAITNSTPATNNHSAASVKTPAPPGAPVKHRSAREDKSRKKDDKSVDHVLRALNSLNTSEEKLAAMCKKYADIFDEHRKLQVAHKQTEKRCSLLQREKEQLQAEHSKAILTRSRLENLCRELQRQNKAVKDESLLKIREEEEKRKEVSAKFQTTMNEITTLMQQNNDKNMKLRDDNIDMTTKLKNICEQYELRQQQVERISKQMQLEQQLADAKLSKLKMEMAAERETLLREKQSLLMELQQYQQRCTELQATEVNLRGQITMYNDKYDEFQKALARSNDVFGGFKGEMEKMSKKICKLEKETSSWKQRWERSHTALLEMAADKQRSEQELGVVSRQLATLQGLCRALQQERANLLAKLKPLQDGEESLPTTEPCSNSCDHPILDLNACDVQDPVSAAVAAVSQLPDVVGAMTNNPSCERLEPPVEPITNGDPAKSEPAIAAIAGDVEQTPAITEAMPLVMTNGDVLSDSSPPPPAVCEASPAPTANGEPLPPSQPPPAVAIPAAASPPPKTPTLPTQEVASPAKVQDSGKKTKESAKKKKK